MGTSFSMHLLDRYRGLTAGTLQQAVSLSLKEMDICLMHILFHLSKEMSELREIVMRKRKIFVVAGQEQQCPKYITDSLKSRSSSKRLTRLLAKE